MYYNNYINNNYDINYDQLINILFFKVIYQLSH